VESALLPPRPGSAAAPRTRGLDAHTVARLAFGLLCVGVAVGIVIYPTYPNYDSYYSLLWGREVLDGRLPVFEGFRVPTEHPLAIVAGAVLSLLGDEADRVWIAMIFASYLALVWGVYRLARIAFTPVVGLIAGGLVLTRFDFAFLAARGYIDVPYMALVVWAAALEAARPRRGAPVFLLLALAGMLRPEAWLLAGLYFVWVAWRPGWGRRAGFAALAALGPAVWALTDLIVTGDPLFSLTYTSSSAEELGRQRTLSELPSAIPLFFSSLVKLPVLVAALLGLGLAAALSPRRAAMPFVLLASGLGTFLLIGIAGLSVIERYLIVAALGLLVFAAVTFGGFTMLRRGAARTAWMAAAAALVLFGLVFTVTRVNLDRFQGELQFRGDAHAALEDVLRTPAVRAGLRCGPLTTPNHKLVPDARWVLDLPFERVRARAQREVGHAPGRGVHLYVNARFAILKQAWTDDDDDPRVQVPPPGAARVGHNEYYTAYVAC
jgi:hypothetical protein